MAKITIVHERDLCIGCGNCASVCPENWEMAADGKSKPKKTVLDKIGCNQQAADGCPVSCIKIITK